jgi:aspartate racemase
MLGILGGMGPMATVDFLGKLVQQTASATDQRHIPTVIWSVPQIPDRSNYIIEQSENPYPELRKGVMTLQSMGATAIAIPCNTAHYWHEKLVCDTGMRILHIADAVIDEIKYSEVDKELPVGILATTGTIRAMIYQSKLDIKGYVSTTPNEHDQEEIMEGISLVKSGQANKGKTIFLRQVDKLRQQGCRHIILGCTEIPAALKKEPYLIDCNLALANRCVKWFEATYNGKPSDLHKASIKNQIMRNKLHTEFNHSIR